MESSGDLIGRRNKESDMDEEKEKEFQEWVLKERPHSLLAARIEIGRALEELKTAIREAFDRIWPWK
jgi:hypothetical protein